MVTEWSGEREARANRKSVESAIPLCDLKWALTLISNILNIFQRVFTCINDTEFEL